MLPLRYFQACRLCLSQNSLTIDIFECSESSELYMKILACLPINVTKEDKLPKGICTKCVSNVNVFYQFWLKTLESQNQLISWLDEPNDSTHETSTVSKESLDYGGSDLSNTATSDESSRFGESEEANYLQEESNDGFVEMGGDDSEDQSGYGNNYGNASCSSATDGERYQGGNNSLSSLSRIFQVLNCPEEELAPPEIHETSNSYNNKMEIEPSSFKCEKCKKSFSCEDILAMHKLSQCDGDDTESVKCKICDESFDNNLTLSYHMSCHDEKKFQCDECGKNFISKHHLRMHSSMHSDSKPFSCGNCGTTFRYKKTFETHVKIHANEKQPSDEKVFVCDICEQRFSTRNLYIHHARSHKNVTSKCKLMCFVCNKTFTSKRMLAHHLRTQCGEETHTCDVCGKELLTKESLECHKLIHVDGKSLICKTCGKSFSHRKYFVVHQRIHTGERPYKCVTCNKTFTQASTLTVHRRYHTGERPYKCFICSKGFVTRTIMLSHLKYHKESEQ